MVGYRLTMLADGRQRGHPLLDYFRGEVLIRSFLPSLILTGFLAFCAVRAAAQEPQRIKIAYLHGTASKPAISLLDVPAANAGLQSSSALAVAGDLASCFSGLPRPTAPSARARR